MMMPARPIANLIVRQAGFALGTLDAFFDAPFRFSHSRKLRQFDVDRCVGQVVIRFDHLVVISVSVPNHDQYFLVAFLSLIGARYHASFDGLNHQRTFRAVTHIICVHSSLVRAAIHLSTRVHGRLG